MSTNTYEFPNEVEPCHIRGCLNPNFDRCAFCKRFVCELHYVDCTKAIGLSEGEERYACTDCLERAYEIRDQEAYLANTILTRRANIIWEHADLDRELAYAEAPEKWWEENPHFLAECMRELEQRFNALQEWAKQFTDSAS